VLTAALKAPGENSLIKLLSPESPAGVQQWLLMPIFPKVVVKVEWKLG